MAGAVPNAPPPISPRTMDVPPHRGDAAHVCREAPCHSVPRSPGQPARRPNPSGSEVASLTTATGLDADSLTKGLRSAQVAPCKLEARRGNARTAEAQSQPSRAASPAGAHAQEVRVTTQAPLLPPSKSSPVNLTAALDVTEARRGPLLATPLTCRAGAWGGSLGRPLRPARRRRGPMCSAPREDARSPSGVTAAAAIVRGHQGTTCVPMGPYGAHTYARDGRRRGTRGARGERAQGPRAYYVVMKHAQEFYQRLNSSRLQSNSSGPRNVSAPH